MSAVSACANLEMQTFHICVVNLISLLSNIRKLNGCEVRIETIRDVRRVAVQHHEACQVMLNSYPELPYFQLT